MLVIIDVPPGCFGEVMSCSLLLEPNTDLIPWLCPLSLSYLTLTRRDTMKEGNTDTSPPKCCREERIIILYAEDPEREDRSNGSFDAKVS